MEQQISDLLKEYWYIVTLAAGILCCVVAYYNIRWSGQNYSRFYSRKSYRLTLGLIGLLLIVSSIYQVILLIW